MEQNIKMPKIAMGAWAWGNDGTFGGSLTESDLRPVFDAAMNAGLKKIADRHGVSAAQIPVAWAVAKGTLPIIGVTKVYQVEEAAQAAALELSAEEIQTMEAMAAEFDLNAIRGWEKEMK